MYEYVMWEYNVRIENMCWCKIHNEDIRFETTKVKEDWKSKQKAGRKRVWVQNLYWRYRSELWKAKEEW